VDVKNEFHRRYLQSQQGMATFSNRTGKSKNQQPRLFKSMPRFSLSFPKASHRIGFPFRCRALQLIARNCSTARLQAMSRSFVCFKSSYSRVVLMPSLVAFPSRAYRRARQAAEDVNRNCWNFQGRFFFFRIMGVRGRGK
jgi:hypothetical protein